MRALVAAQEILVAPGIYDAFTALRVEAAGFQAAFLSGSAVASMHLGRPDIGLLTLPELADLAGRITDRVSIPIFVDADQGFGNAAMAARSMQMLERAGAAGIQMEDQQPVKDSGDWLGRPLVSSEEMVAKIKAALDARRNPDVMLSARSDAMSSEGFDEALDRAAAYAEAGADMIFVENIKSRQQMEKLVDHIGGKKPLLHNLLRTGEDVQDAATLQQLGYSVALFPGVVPAAVGEAVDNAMADLAQSAAITPGKGADRIGAKEYLSSIPAPKAPR